MNECRIVNVIDCQELDILEAICGIQKYWGIVSDEKMDIEALNHRLFEMYKKGMIFPVNDTYQIADEYKKLLRYINTADAMLKIKMKENYQQDYFCYVKEEILAMTKNDRKTGQVRYEFVEKNVFGNFLKDGRYLPDKQGENLEDLEYGLSVSFLKSDGKEITIINVSEEDGVFYLNSKTENQKIKEIFTLERFQYLLWKIIGEV